MAEVQPASALPEWNTWPKTILFGNFKKKKLEQANIPGGTSCTSLSDTHATLFLDAKIPVQTLTSATIQEITS